MNEKEDDFVRFLHQHIVPIYFSLKHNSSVFKTTITSFVLSVQDKWFLITAGHCLRTIQEYINEGYQIESCQLIDSIGPSVRTKYPIPYIYKISEAFYFSEGFDFDYGLLPLSQYYIQLLQANNVKALNEEVWKKQPDKVDYYALLGIPTELVKIDKENIQLVPTMFLVDPIPKKPDCFSDVITPMFYGQIELDSRITNIEGMSGGPIFGFKKGKNGQLRYWLIALQSRWGPDSHYIAACTTNIFGCFLEDVIKKVG